MMRAPDSGSSRVSIHLTWFRKRSASQVGLPFRRLCAQGSASTTWNSCRRKISCNQGWTKESEWISKNITRSSNVILAALSNDEYQRIFPKLEFIPLELGTILYNSGDLIKDVYFPETGVVSLVRHMKEKVTVEVGVIGKEGMVGIPVILGDDFSFEAAVVQMKGDAMRMSTPALKKELKSGNSRLVTQLLAFTRTLMKQVTQTAACNRIHSIEQRLSRWMLMCRDRMGSDELALTQEFIANMLGSRREGVSIAATILQQRNLIRYSRGHISILDKKGLEKFSCECYRATQEMNGTRSNMYDNAHK